MTGFVYYSITIASSSGIREPDAMTAFVQQQFAFTSYLVCKLPLSWQKQYAHLACFAACFQAVLAA